MSKSALAGRRKLSVAVLAAGIAAGATAHATVYTDAVGTAEHFSDSWVDFANVEVTNNATDLTFVINLNPVMNDGTTPNNIQNNNFTKYDIGFDTGPGGSTTLQGAYEQVMGLSTGMDYWVRSWADQNAAPSTLGGYQLFKWDGTSWGTPILMNTTVAITPTSSTLVIPLSSLGLSTGNAFHFDVWSTFNGVQGAYDALANPNRTPGFPFTNGSDPPTPYDGTTGPNYPATLYTIAGTGVSAQWIGAVNGNWSEAGNWTGGIPDGVGHTATFGSAGSTNFNVAVDVSARTLGTMNFDNAATFSIGTTSGNGITMQASSGQAAINVVTGSHTIAAPVTLASDTTFTVTPVGSMVALTGNLTATGRTITKSGAGTVRFENVRASSLNVGAGTVQISSKFPANNPAGTSVVQSLSISAGAKLDLTNNSMIIDYTGPVGTLVGDVRQHLATGRLMTSSIGGLLRGIGYADNASLSPVKTTFAGQTVDPSSLLVKFTYQGDADLDGDVDVADLGALATNWQTSGVWSGGDFDYNGTVDVNDLGMLATNWQQGTVNPLGPDFATAVASLGLPTVSVPEPACLIFTLLVPWSLKRPGCVRHL